MSIVGGRRWASLRDYKYIASIPMQVGDYQMTQHAERGVCGGAALFHRDGVHYIPDSMRHTDSGIVFNLGTESVLLPSGRAMSEVARGMRKTRCPISAAL